jgi:hypothetical protein
LVWGFLNVKLVESAQLQELWKALDAEVNES